jgi:hypothetical protein
VADLRPVGRDAVIANFRRITNVTFRTYQSGRLKVSDDGESLCAVVPTGVYLFAVKQRHAAETDPKPKPKIKVIDPR